MSDNQKTINFLKRCKGKKVKVMGYGLAKSRLELSIEMHDDIDADDWERCINFWYCEKVAFPVRWVLGEIVAEILEGDLVSIRDDEHGFEVVCKDAVISEAD